MASTLALSPIRRQTRSQRRGNRSLLLVATLFIVVLIAEAVIVVRAAPHIADIASLYTTTT
jgi:hypothetical protein